VAERHRLQPRQLVAAIGAADADKQLVANQLATAAGEDGRPLDKARPLLLAAFSREPSDAAAVWEHALEDREAASAGGITDCWVADKMAQGRARQGPVCEQSVPKSSGVGLRDLEGLELDSPAAVGARPRSSAGPRLDAGFGTGLCVMRLESQNGNSG